MSHQRTEAKERDKLLLRLLKTPPQPRPKRERAEEKTPTKAKPGQRRRQVT